MKKWIAEILRKSEDIKVLTIKDYIANPKPSGYQSYHMIVEIPVYMAHGKKMCKVEIQLRTMAMDFWASLEHKMYYKFEGNAPESIRRELKECADLVSFLDQKMMAINQEIKRYAGEQVDEDKEVDEGLMALYGTVVEEIEDFKRVSVY